MRDQTADSQVRSTDAFETALLRVDPGDVAHRKGGEASQFGGSIENQPVVRVELSTLSSGPSPRDHRLCEQHVAVLSEARGNWPPILVRSRDRVIVDGHHRVAAAGRLGLQTISAVLFEGSDDEAYVQAVKQNISHGLALSVSERVTAALGFLCRHPDWSDRRISTICGLSPSTVGNVRSRAAHQGRDLTRAQAARPDTRLGADGRRRPVDRGAQRAHIAHLVMADPSASLRSIARLIGASPETVRAVRSELQARLGAGTVDLPPRQEQHATTAEIAPAFVSTRSGRDFVDWFTKTRITPEDGRYYGPEIPLNRIYEVADEARRRAKQWAEFADFVERRASPRH